MKNDLEKLAFDFVLNESFAEISDYYCETRDIFQARLDKMISQLLTNEEIKDDYAYIIVAITGEIGNNSFDHNVGSWVGVMGVFFGYFLSSSKLKIVLADAGQGVFKTLKKVKPSIKNDQEALYTAFNEKISGRAPESRGNGLKFVKQNIRNRGMHLTFYSGRARAELNEKENIIETEDNFKGCVAIIDL